MVDGNLRSAGPFVRVSHLLAAAPVIGGIARAHERLHTHRAGRLARAFTP